MATWKNCDGMTRRDCLQLGLGTLLGGGLATHCVLRAALRAAPTQPRSPCKRRAAS